MSIQNEINRLVAAKANIKAAINAKGGNLTGESISQYATAVSALDVGGGVSGGITPFTVAYGEELPETAVENQIFVITEQTPPAIAAYANVVEGLEIKINYTEEPFDDVLGRAGTIEMVLEGTWENGIKVNLGNGVTFNTGIAAPSDETPEESGYPENACLIYEEDGYCRTIPSYLGHNGAWVKISNGDDSGSYSLRRAGRQ